MPPHRKSVQSLKARNKASIDADPIIDRVAMTEPAAPTPVVVPAPPQAARQPVTAARDTVRIGVYLTPAQFTDAKAAYLTDWQHGGSADTFGRWIARAIDAHATRTPQQRAALGQPRGRAAVRTGASRSFAIPADTVARMRAAINADHTVGRWPSDSAWCAEAIDHAIAAARALNGGTLPTPPPRLPNRLTR